MGPEEWRIPNTDTKGPIIVTDTTHSPEDFLRVSGASNPQKVAQAIAHALYDHHTVKVRCVGAPSVNQAVKAMAIARGYVAPRGMDLTFKPGFTAVPSRDDPNEDISAIVFIITVS